jgi:hypothetical protein
VTERVAEFEPAAFLTVRPTVNVSAVANVWSGFWSVLVSPSPKVHDHDVGVPEEVSVNCTARFTTGEPGENVNAATGAEGVG